MSEEMIFPEGIYAKQPHDNAPDFVKCKVSMKREEVIAWLQCQDDDWINLDVKESRDGKWYCSVDTWKPNSTPDRGEDVDMGNVPF